VVPLHGFGKIRAIDIQQIYLGCVEGAEARGVLPSWAGKVIAEWRRVLADLEHAPDSVATSLDWAIRYSIYRDRAAGAISTGSGSSGRTKRAVKSREQSRFAGMPDCIVDDEGGRQWKATASEVHPSLRQRLGEFNALRAELYETDIRFAQLGDGIFRRLDEAGVLSHRMRASAPSRRLSTKVPREPRRASFPLGAQAGGQPGFVCSWDEIVNTIDGSRLAMSDPFDTDVTREFTPRRRRKNGCWWIRIRS